MQKKHTSTIYEYQSPTSSNPNVNSQMLNVNHNCSWLKFEINRQPEGCWVTNDINRQPGGYWVTNDINRQPGGYWVTNDINRQPGGYWLND